MAQWPSIKAEVRCGLLCGALAFPLGLNSPILPQLNLPAKAKVGAGPASQIRVRVRVRVRVRGAGSGSQN